MYLFCEYIILLLLSVLCSSEQWPYNRYHGIRSMKGHFVPEKSRPEFQEEPHNLFGQWFHGIVESNQTEQFQDLFINGSIPHHATFDDILNSLKKPKHISNISIPPPHIPRPWPQGRATTLFEHLPYPVDPRCTSDTSKW
jgi:hypothetical protein